MNKVKKYYDNLIDSGSDEFGALARTAKVFSISINQVKRELGRKPKNRVRKPKPQRV